MTSKTVSQLTPEGYYTGQTTADESPLEPGVWLMPAGAVDMAAPSVPAGMRARLVDGDWQFEPAPTPDPQSTPTPPTLPDLIQTTHALIDAWRDQEENAAIVFTHAGRTWDGGLKVRTRLQPVIALPALPSGFFWTDAENNDVPMDVLDIVELNAAHEQAIVTRGFEIHIRQRQMKTEVSALTTAEAVAAYTIGWPA